MEAEEVNLRVPRSFMGILLLSAPFSRHCNVPTTGESAIIFSPGRVLLPPPSRPRRTLPFRVARTLQRDGFSCGIIMTFYPVEGMGQWWNGG
jgi:hypothetical protein